MNPLKIIFVLILAGVVQTFAKEPDTSAISLEAAREQGRANSRLLKEHSTVTKELTAIPEARVSYFHEAIKPILNKSCLGCHGPDKSEGRLRLDQLDPDLLKGGNVERWREIFNAVSNSVMPPEEDEEYALTGKEREEIVDWLVEELNNASIVRRHATEHSSFRRLTKYEYNNALQDLLGLPFTFANRLPPESASVDGFKNSSELLQMSAMQFETYREIGLAALKRAIVADERPQSVTYIISMQEELDKATLANNTKDADKNDKGNRRKRMGLSLLNRETGEETPFREGSALPKENAEVGLTPKVSQAVLVLPGSSEIKWNLDRFLPDEGVMRVRIRAGRTTSNPEHYASLRLIFSAHTSNNANFSQVISSRDVPVTATADEPQYITFDIPLQDIQRNPFRKLETTFPRRDEFLSIRNVSNAGGREGTQIYIDHIEISAPFYEQWPPKTHTDIFIESQNKDDEEVYGREVLSRFMRRVWRRPVTTQEVDPFMALLAKYRADLPRFEDAMVEVLATTLASPEFLYLTQRASVDRTSEETGERQTISDLELASRLSFFLWTSIPDEELLALAEQGKLKDPQALNVQVDRMLADSRSRRFTENFVQQWLGLDGLENVNHVSDATLKDAMREEPIAFFEDVLQSNASVMDFVHSNYVVVNEALARHYGIQSVYGPHFRKVSVEPQNNRGGIFTAAGILTMNSDGKDSHPLKRGVWMLKRILQDPPPPPPPNVPEVDLTNPEILKMTLKERIVDHRNKPACLSCHSKIDPWGIAFENFDALGRYRTEIQNKPVDATSLLFNKQELAGMNGLKRYLLTNRQDQLTRALVDKMTSYALGRPLSFSDRADIESLTLQFRKQDDRLRDLLHLIVNSNIFRSR